MRLYTHASRVGPVQGPAKSTPPAPEVGPSACPGGAAGILFQLVKDID
jgi:hypothetical protein